MGYVTLIHFNSIKIEELDLTIVVPTILRVEEEVAKDLLKIYRADECVIVKEPDWVYKQTKVDR